MRHYPAWLHAPPHTSVAGRQRCSPLTAIVDTVGHATTQAVNLPRIPQVPGTELGTYSCLIWCPWRYHCPHYTDEEIGAQRD